MSFRIPMYLLILLFALSGSGNFAQADQAAGIDASESRNGAEDQVGASATPSGHPVSANRLDRLKYNHPGLTVDLGVGLWAWPIPVDYDGDGDYDLVVSCPDTPYNGVYLFENTSGNTRLPVFKPGVRLGKGLKNVGSSFVNGKCRVLTPGKEYPEFLKSGFAKGVSLSVGPNVHANKVRANQWKYVDFDGDGNADLIVGAEDWTDYGWDNAFDSQGRWTRGPLHGFVYWMRNSGTDAAPRFDRAVKIEAGGKPIDTYGMPCPCVTDFDGDGDLDILCGDFIGGFTHFENIGTRSHPDYSAGRHLTADGGQPLEMDLCMIVPVDVDWNRDGRVDLIVAQEDGRVAFVENTGKVANRLPVFKQPMFFQQSADDVKFGALATPVGFDWNSDGKEDLLCGSTAGYIGWIENLDGENPPRWAAPRYLAADGKIIRIQAGINGSIQGPAEAKWGYTTLSVADWDGDGLFDLIVNSIWGKVIWYRNIGTRENPQLAAAQSIEVEWSGKPMKPAWTWWEPQGKELVTQWRTTPFAIDWTGDGLCDLVMLDAEGYLALYERKRDGDKLVLLPPRRVFTGRELLPPKGLPLSLAGQKKESSSPSDKEDGFLRLNALTAGASGRRKFCIVDWDGDNRLDIVVNSVNVNWLRNAESRDGQTAVEDRGPLANVVLAGHDSSPTAVHWNKDGIPDLLIGAEDGHLYFLANPRHSGKTPNDTTGKAASP
jgi:hypothetical protein